MLEIIDLAIFELINISCHNAVFNFIMPLFSQVWIIWVGALLCIATYAIHCWRGYLEPIGRVVMLVLLMGLSVAVTDSTTSVLKHSIGRERPCGEVIGSHCYNADTHQWSIVTEESIGEHKLGGSMPSAPAAACMAIAVVLSLLFYRSNPWVYLLPTSVGFAQVYVGKNYPFDVFIGWMIGFVAVIVVWWVCHLIFVRFSSHHKLNSSISNK